MSPRIVRQIDWIDKVWPRHLKEMQIEATNSVDEMMYPKVSHAVRLGHNDEQRGYLSLELAIFFLVFIQNSI